MCSTCKENIKSNCFRTIAWINTKSIASIGTSVQRSLVTKRRTDNPAKAVLKLPQNDERYHCGLSLIVDKSKGYESGTCEGKRGNEEDAGEDGDNKDTGKSEDRKEKDMSTQRGRQVQGQGTG